MKILYLTSFLLFFTCFSYAQDEVFMIVEESPRFPGCEQSDLSTAEKEQCAQTKFLEFIYNNLKYPESARKNNVEGQVVVQFVVDKDGSLQDINIVRDIGEGCGEEVIKVIELMNDLNLRWRPGYQRGQAVKVKYTLPVKFKLEGDNKSKRKSFLSKISGGE